MCIRDRGEIAVDGNSIAKLRRSALRGMYGMVLQETWLCLLYTSDVYKRQAEHKPQRTTRNCGEQCFKKQNQRNVPLFHAQYTVKAEFLFAPLAEKAVGVEPVSYTHLDVYKRQVY